MPSYFTVVESTLLDEISFLSGRGLCGVSVSTFALCRQLAKGHGRLLILDLRGMPQFSFTELILSLSSSLWSLPTNLRASCLLLPYIPAKMFAQVMFLRTLLFG